MLLVLITFLLGGNIYMVICKSWQNQQLFQVSSLWKDASPWSCCSLSSGCWWNKGSAGRFGTLFPDVLLCS